MLYFLAFTLQTSVRKYHNVSVSTWGQCRWFEKSYISPVIMTKVRQLHLDCSHKKRTPEFLGEIQAMINNDQIQNVWVSYQAGSAWIHSAFRIYNKKESIFIRGHERQEVIPRCKAFKLTQESPRTEYTLFFTEEKNLYQDQMVIPQNNCWFALSPQDVQIAIITKLLVNIMMFVLFASDGNFFIFSQGLRLNMEVHIHFLEEVVSWILRIAAGRSYVWRQDSVPCYASNWTQS